MIAWRRWILPGLLGVSLLTVAGLATSGRRMAADLAARVDAALAAADQSWAGAKVDGRTVTVAGTAPTVAAQRIAVETASRVAGVFKVIDESGVLPLQADYRWVGARSAEGIVLSGYVPSEDDRLAILAAIRQLAPEVPLSDRTALARGQPEDFLDLARFAIARLVELSDGDVVLQARSLSVDGTASSEASFATAASALSGALPAGAELRNVRILPPRTERFIWRARFDGGTVRLSGYVPSEQTRRDIAAAIRATLSADVDDQTHLASGAPEGFGSAAVFAAYQIARLAEADIALDGTTLSIEGKARTVEDYQAALSEIDARRERPGAGIEIGAVDIVPAFVDPYVWRAERVGGTVTLGGFMPTDEAHDEIVRLATELFPGAAVVDHVRVAAGDPKMDWIGASIASLRHLALLGKGTVSLTGRDYDISGEAISTDAYEELVGALGRTLPASMELRRNEVAPAAVSPFLFSMTRSGKAAVTITGYVPTRDVAGTIADRARRRFPPENVEMRVQLAGGAPEGLVAAADAGLQAISRLDGGKLELVDRKLTISGVAVSEGAERSIEADLSAALPATFEATLSVMLAVGGDPLTAAECQAALAAEFEHEKIAFDNASAEIQPESYGLIDRAAAIIQRCPAAAIEVGGHTDSGGGVRANRALSEARAEAVLGRLVEDGVRRERLSAVGYGESRPIASNSNAAGRAQNRRIEFSVTNR